MAMVETVDIAFKNIDASVNNIDIDNVLLQNFLYKPTLSVNCLNLKEFKGNWTNYNLASALFNKIIQNLD